MPYFTRGVVVWTMAVFLSVVTISGARAQFCSGNLICKGTLTCHKIFFGLFGFCELVRCNDDTDCGVTDHPSICLLGICEASCQNNASCGSGKFCNRNTGRPVGVCAPQLAAPIGTGSNPSSGAGGVCGPQEVAPGIIKIQRCKDGLICTNDRCTRPLQ
jgi:hypothetical protein